MKVCFEPKAEALATYQNIDKVSLEAKLYEISYLEWV
jgi:hypothetical protein